MVERKLILCGTLAGALAGILALVFARVFAEPQLQGAIDNESGRDAAQAALDRAAGRPVDAGTPEVFSRTLQADVGLGAGLVVFGIAMGALFAVVYTVSLGRAARLRPRPLALLLAGAGFLTIT